MPERLPTQLPSAPVVAVVEHSATAEPVLHWARREACRLGCDAGVVYAPACDALADHAPTCADIDRGYKEILAIAARLNGQAPFPVVLRADSSANRLRDELLTSTRHVLVVGPIQDSVLAQLLFGQTMCEPIPVPVVVVPAATRLVVSPAPQRPVLTVGFHPSPAAEAALRWATTEAERLDAQVRTVFVWCEDQLASLAGSVRVSSHRNALVGRAATSFCHATLANCGAPLDRVSCSVVRGAPAPVLIREAAGTDLLVIGSAHATLHDQPILGSTTLGCVARSVVPVAIIPSL